MRRDGGCPRWRPPWRPPPKGRRRCGSPAPALLAPRTLSEAALARSVGLDIGSFTIPSTPTDSAPDGTASGGAGGAGGGGRSTRLATAWRCWVWLCLPCSGSDLRSDSGLRPHWRPRRVADPKNRPSRRPGEKHCSSFYTSCTNVEFVQDQGLLSVSCEGRRHSSTLVLDGDAVLTEFLI